MNHQQVEPEEEGGGQEDAPEGEAAEGRQLRRVGTSEGRTRLSEVVEQGLEVLDGGPGATGERSRLEVGQQVGQTLIAPGLSGGLQRAVDADLVGGRHEELGTVKGEVVGGCRCLGSLHPNEAGAAVLVDHDPSGGEVAVGDARGVQPVEVGPGVVQHPVVDRVGRDVGQRPARGVAQHEQRVVTGTGDADREEIGDHRSGALGQEQHQGLVFDLLATA